MNRRWPSNLCRRSVAFVLLLFALDAVASPQAAAPAGPVSPSAQLHKAVDAAQRGDNNKALALTNAVLVEHPNFEPALKFQGALLEAMGRAAEASTPFQKALELAPGDAELLLKVGIFHLVSGDYVQAIDLFTRRLKLLPHDGDTLYYLAQAYHLQGDNKLALTTIQASLKVDPSNISVWQKYGELLCSSGDNEAAIRWLSKAQHADPSLDRIEFDLAVASYNNQDLENAATYAANAVTRRPNDSTALALLASIDVKLAKWQQAKPLFQQILAMKSDDPPSLLGLGLCDLKLKNYQLAADSLERLLQQDPTQVLAHFYLSRTYAALGRPADAEREANLHSKILEQTAATVPAGEGEVEKATFEQARQLLRDNHTDQALQLFRVRARGPYATAGAPYMLVGTLYLYMGRPDDAQQYLNKAISIEPAVHGAHTYLGILALQRSDLPLAESEFSAELARDPNYQLAQAELGEVRYRQGRYDEAAEQLSRSRTISPSLLYMLCDAYFRLGKVGEADLTAELIVDYSKRDAETLQRVLDLLNRNHQPDLAQRLSTR